MRVHWLTTFAAGILAGAIAMFGYVHFQRHDPVMSCTGRVQLDTASHEDLRLNNAVFIDDLDAPRGQMYLRFRNDRAMNEAIGKHVTATGPLKSVQLENGESITELQVSNIQYLPSTSYNSGRRDSDDVP